MCWISSPSRPFLLPQSAGLPGQSPLVLTRPNVGRLQLLPVLRRIFLNIKEGETGIRYLFMSLIRLAMGNKGKKGGINETVYANISVCHSKGEQSAKRALR